VPEPERRWAHAVARARGHRRHSPSGEPQPGRRPGADRVRLRSHRGPVRSGHRGPRIGDGGGDGVPSPGHGVGSPGFYSGAGGPHRRSGREMTEPATVLARCGPGPRRVAIVGGGITGLAAAHRLVELSASADVSLDLILLEASDRLGGTITTEQTGGYLIEGG